MRKNPARAEILATSIVVSQEEISGMQNLVIFIEFISHFLLFSLFPESLLFSFFDAA